MLSSGVWWVKDLTTMLIQSREPVQCNEPVQCLPIYNTHHIYTGQNNGGFAKVYGSGQIRWIWVFRANPKLRLKGRLNSYPSLFTTFDFVNKKSEEVCLGVSEDNELLCRYNDGNKH